jgi:hypothetical protein
MTKSDDHRLIDSYQCFSRFLSIVFNATPNIRYELIEFCGFRIIKRLLLIGKNSLSHGSLNCSRQQIG